MKKIVLSFMLLAVVMLSSTISIAGQNPVTDLTGKVWMESSHEVKMALIYGVECAVAMEYLTAKHREEADGEKASHDEIVKSLTAFPENWILAFSGVERASIVDTLDKWYTDNPTELDRPVFNVLWYEVMEPTLKKR